MHHVNTTDQGHTFQRTHNFRGTPTFKAAYQLRYCWIGADWCTRLLLTRCWSLHKTADRRTRQLIDIQDRWLTDKTADGRTRPLIDVRDCWSMCETADRCTRQLIDRQDRWLMYETTGWCTRLLIDGWQVTDQQTRPLIEGWNNICWSTIVPIFVHFGTPYASAMYWCNHATSDLYPSCTNFWVVVKLQLAVLLPWWPM